MQREAAEGPWGGLALEPPSHRAILPVLISFFFLEMASFISICHFIHGTNYQNGGKQKQKGHLVGFYRNYH